MTYAELNRINTTDMITNSVIDDVLNNGRFCFGRKNWKKIFETEMIPGYELRKIAESSRRAGFQFPVTNFGLCSVCRYEQIGSYHQHTAD